MAERGQRIEGYDSEIEFIETTAETDGERVVIEIFYQGTGIMPPEHFHPNQTERFDVLEGEILAVVDGKEMTLKPGDSFDVPAGTTHQMWCDVPSRQRWTTTPALKTENFFETMWGLQKDSKAGAPAPSLAQTALTLRHFAEEFRLTSPPPPLQELLDMPLAELELLAHPPAESDSGQ